MKTVADDYDDHKNDSDDDIDSEAFKHSGFQSDNDSVSVKSNLSMSTSAKVKNREA